MDHPERVTHYKFEDFCIDIEKQKLLNNGRPATLSPKAFSVLVMLVRRPNEVVEKDEIISHIWPDSFVEEGNLTQYVHHLRKVLGLKKDGAPFIETINKAGYRFTAEPEEISASARDFAPREHLSKTDSIRGRPVLVISIALAIAAIFLSLTDHPEVSLASREIHSIAVLPFHPIESDQSDNGLAEGITDAVITKLSRSGDFSVKPASSVLPVGRTDKDPVSAGRRLKVDAVMEGSAQRDKDRVRLTVRLIKVGNGEIVWAESFNAAGAHSFEMQESISKKVADSYIDSRKSEVLDSAKDQKEQPEITEKHLAPG